MPVSRRTASQIYYSSTAAGGNPQIYVAGVDGKGFRRVSHRDAIEVEPKVNPKNPDQLLFVSGPGPSADLYDELRGRGVTGNQRRRQASNPSWHPDGQHMAFAWTRGYAKGDFNIFVMDVGSRQFVQLTHSEGKNENPAWAPTDAILFLPRRAAADHRFIQCWLTVRR